MTGRLRIDRPAAAPGGDARRVPVPPGAAGMRLDRLLAEALPGLSRTRLKALIEAGHVSLRPGGATISEPSHRVKSGQIFDIFIPESTPAEPAGEAIPLAVVYEDDDVVVIDKPAGLVVHPAPGNPAGTLVNALIAHCGAGLSGIGGVRRPGIVHRLDKETSGLMVIAKNDMAHQALAAQFKDRSIDRAYTAFVWGRPPRAQGEIAGNIGRHPRNRRKMAVLTEGGRPALTRYRLVRPLGPAASVLECRLATGRTHQIRVHCAWKGMPVIGDATYGGGLTAARRAALGDAAEAVARLGRHALHAHRLGFTHPRTAERLEFESDLPSELSILARRLERL